MTALSLDTVMTGLRQLPSLPAVVMELLATFEQENLDADSLARKIGRDQALSARALHLANSSFYGLGGRVVSVHDAMVVLGLRNLRTLVTTAAVIEHFPKAKGIAFDQRGFWRHGLGTALCARILAADAGCSPDGAFTAGLLHDIGRLVLVTCFPDRYAEVLAWREEHDAYPLDAEQAVLGLDHTQVGAGLAKRWQFPPEIQEAVAGHHAPDDLPASSLAGVVHAADVLAHALDFSGDPDDLVPPLSAAVWQRLGLDPRRTRSVLAETEKQCADALSILEP